METQESPFLSSSIPHELIIAILSFLKLSELVHIARVNKFLNGIASECIRIRWKESKKEVVALAGRTYDQVSLNDVEIYDPVKRTWRPGTSMIRKRDGHSVCVLDNLVYAIGGKSNGFTTSLKDVEVYDPLTDTWTELPAMPGTRFYHTCSTYKHFIYVFCGLAGEPVIRYDTKSQVWEQIECSVMAEDAVLIENVNGKELKKLETRLAPSTVSYNGKMYILGGSVKRNPTATCYMFDPLTNTFTDFPPMTRARSGLSSVVHNGKIYAIGGWNSTEQLKNGEYIDLTSPNPTWTPLGSDMSVRRAAINATVLDDCIYIAGGYDGTNTTSVFECYDIYNKTWHQLEPLGSPKQSVSLVTVFTKKFFPNVKESNDINNNNNNHLEDSPKHNAKKVFTGSSNS